IITKTAEGTIDGTGVMIPDTDNDGKIDYRPPVGGFAAVVSGPEFLSVFSGATGKELARVPWIARGNLSQWGDSNGNRGNRNNLTVACLDGKTPSIIMCRGIYERMKMEAWNFRNGQLTNVWKWDSETDPLYQQWQVEQGVSDGKGSHMIRSGDVDGDGRDETLRGSLTMGPTGVPLFTKAQGHGDEIRFGDLYPDRPGLEVWIGYEHPPTPVNGMQLYDAATGGVIYGIRTGSSVGSDVGKSQAAPLNPAQRGFQFWGWDGTYDTQGNLLTTSQPADGNRHEVWWDGRLTRDLTDEARVSRWDPVTQVKTDVFTGDGYGYAGTADVLGDWREEIISPRPTELRIYSTTISATNRLYTLMHDPVYRHSAAVQAQRKVPTSTPGFYLGPDMLKQPIAPISDADIVWTGGGSNVWDGLTTNWHVNWYWSTNETATTFVSGKTVLFDLSGVSTNPVVLDGSLTPGSVMVHAGNDYTFDGSGSLAGSMKLTKAGRGTLTINTTNSYTGTTLLTAGSVFVNGRLDQSPVIVRGGDPWGPTELGGRGTLGNGVAVQAGAGISPGQGLGSPDTLHIQNGLALSGRTLSKLDLSDDPTGITKANDLIAVAGNLTLTGTNTFQVNQLDGALSPGTYPLVSYTGSLIGGPANIQLSGVAGIPFVVTNSPGQIALFVRSTRAATGGLTWLGGQGNQWDLANRTNWLNGGVQDWFITGDQVIFNDSGSVNPFVTLNDTMIVGQTLVDSTVNYTISGSGSIGGPGGITKSNTGKLTLLTANTYTGRTTLAGGTLELSSLAEAAKPNPLGMSSVDPTNLILWGGSTLRLTGLSTTYTDRGATFTNGVCTVEVVNGSTDFSLDGLLTGDGTLQKTGSGTLNLNGNNAYTGGTIISGGTLNVSKQSSLGSSIGSLTFANGGTLGGSPGTFTRPIILQSGGGVFNFGSSISTLISGTGGFTLTGGGQLTIGGVNTYSGGTTISDGTIWVTVPGALGTGNVTVKDGGSLVIRPGGTQFANNLTLAGSGVLGYSGAIFLSGADGTFAGSVTLSADATIGCANTSGLDVTLNGPVNLGSRTLSMSPGIVTAGNSVKWSINGVISGTGNLIWDSINTVSTLTLRGANTFTGETSIRDVCALVLSNSLALQNSTLNYTNGALRFGNGLTAFTLGALTGNRNLALTNAGGAAVTLSIGNDNRSTLYSGSISQSGGLNKIGTGTLTLSGTNVYEGATVVSGGTLELTGVLTNNNTVSISGGATLKLFGGTLGVAATTVLTNGLLTGNGTIQGSLQNNGLVVVNGVMTINGSVTNNGTIFVPFGSTLIFNGPVVNNGVVDASSGGTVIVNSTWTGNPLISVPPGASYTNTFAGNWSAVAWQPTQPVSGIQTTNVFKNTAAINSTNDLGAFNLNQLRFDNQLVNLRGSALQFGGVAPSL
ncbi:MAG: autotransporter-associated beta strand repeat-containing protein, partial [Verrucomicrobiota bacterium]